MHEAFLPRQTFDEAAEFLDRADDALVGLADFDLRGREVDFADRELHGFLARREDVDAAGIVLVDVDLRAGKLADAANVLPAGTDERADFVRRNHDRADARRGGLDRGRRSGLGFRDEPEDFFARLAVAENRLFRDVDRQAVNLEVELEAGDSRVRAADFEVHVAEVVFRADDVREHDVLADFSAFVVERDEPAGNAGDGSGNGNAGVHERERSAADGSHRGRTVRLHDFGRNADGVRELFLAREHGNERAFRERAVADFAAAGRAEFSAFADRERREVVVQDERFRLRPAGKTVELLRVLRGAERRDDERLRFAALENRRAVHAGQHVRLAGDRAQLIERAAVRADAFFEDAFAINFFLQFFKGDVDVARVDVFLAEFGDDRFLRLGLHGVDGGVALKLAGQINRLGELFVRVRDALADFENFFVADDEREILLRLGDFGGEFPLRGDELLNRLVREFKRFDETLVRHLVGGAFNHHHVLLVPDVDEIERRVQHLFVRGIDDEFAVDFADAHRADRAVPRDVRAKQRGGSAVDHQHVRIRHLVRRKQQTDDLHFVQKSFREQRAQRAVAEARGENFLFRRASFALEIAARETAGGGEFFAVIDRQREEILVGGTQFVGGGRGDEHRRASAGHRHGAVGLAGNRARADRDAEIFDRHIVFLLHMLFTSFLFPRDCGNGFLRCCF